MGRKVQVDIVFLKEPGAEDAAASGLGTVGDHELQMIGQHRSQGEAISFRHAVKHIAPGIVDWDGVATRSVADHRSKVAPPCRAVDIGDRCRPQIKGRGATTILGRGKVDSVQPELTHRLLVHLVVRRGRVDLEFLFFAPTEAATQAALPSMVSGTEFNSVRLQPSAQATAGDHANKNKAGSNTGNTFLAGAELSYPIAPPASPRIIRPGFMKPRPNLIAKQKIGQRQAIPAFS